MRIANLAGRAVLLSADGAIDLEKDSDGRFPADPQAVYSHWEALRSWTPRTEPLPYDRSDLGPPVPAPRQLFAIGVNYADHAAEAGADVSTKPAHPPTFTKFASSLTGPYADVTVPEGAMVDWEVELVVVIGRTAHRASDGWSYVAGLTVGQDLTDRITQFTGPPPQQYSLGKSYPGFGPIGPAVVTPDELADPDDLALSCSVNGVAMQDARTSDLIFSVPELVERLSAVATLYPGDLIFTGTPAGIGITRTPALSLSPGDVLTSEIEGLGTLTTTFKER